MIKGIILIATAFFLCTAAKGFQGGGGEPPVKVRKAPPSPRASLIRKKSRPAKLKRVIPTKKSPVTENVSKSEAGSRANRKRASAFFEAGIANFDRFEYDYALSHFSKAIEIYPTYVEAYYNRALAYSRKGDTQAAIADYNKVIELDPSNSEAFNNRGTIYLGGMNPEAALADFTQAIEQYPIYISSFASERGKTHRLGRTDKQLAENKALFPVDLALIYTNRGATFRYIRNYEAALRDFDRAIEFDPKYFKAYIYRGITNLDRNYHDAAIVDCGRAIELGAFSIDARKCINGAQESKSKYETNILELSMAIIEDPDSHTNIYSRANLYLQYNKYADAVRDYDKVLELNPRFAFAFLNRGIARYFNKEYDMALFDLDHALELNANLPDAHIRKGLVYVAMGNFDSAISEYSKAIVLAPNLGSAYFERGLAHIASRKYEAAVADLTRYIEYDPAFPDTYRLRASVYDLMGLKDLADNDRKMAKEKSPS